MDNYELEHISDELAKELSDNDVFYSPEDIITQTQDRAPLFFLISCDRENQQAKRLTIAVIHRIEFFLAHF